MRIEKIDELIGSVVVEFDPYVPVNVKWGTWNEFDESSIYYRYGDLKSSLLEISIGSVTGTLRSLTLVCIKSVGIHSERIETSITYDDGKIPNFETEGKDQNLQINASEFLRVEMFSDAISINLSNNSKVRTLRMGRVYVGVDDTNEIVSIIISELSQHEIESFKSAI